MTRLRAPERRQQLIRSAAGVFARYGYEGATTAAIAEAAGVTEPVLYRHFRGKHALFAAIVDELLQGLRQRWQSGNEPANDPVARLRLAGERYVRAVVEMPDYYAVLFGAILNSQDRQVLKVIREYYDASERHIGALVARGQRTGVFRTDLDARKMAWVMIGVSIGFAMQELKLRPGHISAELFTEAVLSTVRART
jgi:AcrR family transcriptional regulator